MLLITRNWKSYFMFSVIIVIVTFLARVSPLLAYKSQSDFTYARLPGNSTLLWIFYDDINSGLGISNSGVHTTHALNQWDITSSYTVFDVASSGSNTQSTNTIKVIDFDQFVLTPCGPISNYLGVPAITCSPNKVIYIDTDSNRWRWNTTGGMYPIYDPVCGCTPRAMDYLTIVLHELGHYWGLTHPSSASPSVMYPDPNTAKQNLLDDDKQGAVQFYGPYTGWETNVTLNWFPGYSYVETQGISETLYSLNTNSQQLVPSVAELNVTPYSGARYLKLYGNSQLAYSYAYMKLFSADKDELGSNPNHLTVQNGMTLRWSQYSHAQTRMSLDIVFSDGTTLRDSGLKDQYGVRVHPAFRSVYSTGVWRQFVVDLSPLAGKRVKHILIAYDNGNSGQTGIFRGYFDNIELNY